MAYVMTPRISYPTSAAAHRHLMVPSLIFVSTAGYMAVLISLMGVVHGDRTA